MRGKKQIPADPQSHVGLAKQYLRNKTRGISNLTRRTLIFFLKKNYLKTNNMPNLVLEDMEDADSFPTCHQCIRINLKAQACRCLPPQR